MAALENIIDVSKIKELIFGKNNIRLDVLIDKFYSIRQEKRSKLVFYCVIGLFLFFVSLISMYVYGLYNLQNQLDDAFANYNDLNNIKSSYVFVNQEFSKIVGSLKSVNNVNSIQSAIDQKAKELNIDLSFVTDKPTLSELASGDALFGQFQKARIECKLNTVSLKKIIDFINTIQKTDNKFKIDRLEIQQKFGTRLYFDVNLTISAFVNQR